MPVLADPRTVAGPLNAADMDEARAYSTGRIYRLHRVALAGRDTCNGSCETHEGCNCCQPYPAEAWADIADTRPAALSMARHHRTTGRVMLALLLTPALTAVVAVGGFVLQHLSH